MRTRLFSLLLALVLIVGTIGGMTGCSNETATNPPASNGTETPAAESARATFLLPIADLKASPDKYFVIDARDPKAYAAGHIPGAISLPWQPFATVAVGAPGDKDWGVLSAPQAIADALGKAGVDTAKTIVVYSDPTGWGEDGRVMWSMQSIGIENILMLDGGFPGWLAAGNETTTEVPAVTATTVAVGADKLGEINVTTDEVKAAVEAKTAKIVDARSTKEFDGATDFGEKRGGRIPGAVNIPFPNLFNEDATVKSDADLEAMFSEAGLAKTDEIIVYCTKGIRSAYMMELLHMLGYTGAKNYDASFYAWAGDSSLAVEK